jgi:uncharacterized protein (DUF2147 family)
MQKYHFPTSSLEIRRYRKVIQCFQTVNDTAKDSCGRKCGVKLVGTGVILTLKGNRRSLLLSIMQSNFFNAVQRLTGLVVVFLFCSLTSLMAQKKTIIGTWKAVDNGTNDVRVHVQIFEFEGKLYGKVVKLIKNPSDQKCTICPGELRNKPLMGMMVLEKLQLQNGFYQNGKLLDTQSGRWYSCQMWLKEEDPDILVVRGFLGFIYKTQHWYRVE